MMRTTDGKKKKFLDAGVPFGRIDGKDGIHMKRRGTSSFGAALDVVKGCWRIREAVRFGFTAPAFAVFLRWPEWLGWGRLLRPVRALPDFGDQLALGVAW